MWGVSPSREAPLLAAGDELVGLEDKHKRLPRENPDALVLVNSENYLEVPDLMRSIDFCKLCFETAAAGTDW